MRISKMPLGRITGYYATFSSSMNKNIRVTGLIYYAPGTVLDRWNILTMHTPFTMGTKP